VLVVLSVELLGVTGATKTARGAPQEAPWVRGFGGVLGCVGRRRGGWDWVRPPEPSSQAESWWSTPRH